MYTCTVSTKATAAAWWERDQDEYGDGSAAFVVTVCMAMYGKLPTKFSPVYFLPPWISGEIGEKLLLAEISYCTVLLVLSQLSLVSFEKKSA